MFGDVVTVEVTFLEARLCSFSRVVKLLTVSLIVLKRYIAVLLDLFCELDASIRFVQVFVEFIDFVLVHSSDCIVNKTQSERTFHCKLLHLCPEMHAMTKMADLAKELHN